MVDARKIRFSADDLVSVLNGFETVVIAKGQKVVSVNLKGSDLDQTELADLAKAVIGRSGNLRAPTVKSGKTVLVGYNDAAWNQVFG